MFIILALQVQLNQTEREHIPAGVRIHLIKASRGSYIRTPDGKFFAIRSSQIPSENNNNNTHPKFLPMPPPTSSSSSLNPIDQFLFGKAENFLENNFSFFPFF